MTGAARPDPALARRATDRQAAVDALMRCAAGLPETVRDKLRRVASFASVERLRHSYLVWADGAEVMAFYRDFHGIDAKRLERLPGVERLDAALVRLTKEF